MHVLRKLRLIAAVAVASGGLTAAAITPASAATEAWSDCPSGYFCAWSGSNGTGSRCQWEGNSESWYFDCSWAGNKYPHSVYNHGTSGRGVTIYAWVSWEQPIGGCVTKGEKVNLAGNYYIGSHAWNC